MEAPQRSGDDEGYLLIPTSPRPWRTQRNPSILTRLIPPPAEFSHSAIEISPPEPSAESHHESGIPYTIPYVLDNVFDNELVW